MLQGNLIDGTSKMRGLTISVSPFLDKAIKFHHCIPLIR